MPTKDLHCLKQRARRTTDLVQAPGSVAAYSCGTEHAGSSIRIRRAAPGVEGCPCALRSTDEVAVREGAAIAEGGQWWPVRPEQASGEPGRDGDLGAFVDESMRTSGGGLYLVTAAVVVEEDRAAIEDRLRAAVSRRRRSVVEVEFHVAGVVFEAAERGF
jgi:hypothetical protein